MKECLNDRLKRISKENGRLEEKIETETSCLLEQLTDAQSALTEQYEENIKLAQLITETQLALCEIYELMGE